MEVLQEPREVMVIVAVITVPASVRLPFKPINRITEVTVALSLTLMLTLMRIPTLSPTVAVAELYRAALIIQYLLDLRSTATLTPMLTQMRLRTPRVAVA